MADFSVTAAVGAGFQVIGRKPLAVMVWGLLMALSAVPALLILLWVLPEFQMAMAERAQGVAPPSMASLARLQLKLTLLQPVMMVTNAVLYAVLSAAVYRAVLTPEDDRRFYLRFGAAELWLILLTLVVGVLFGLALVVVMIVGGGFTAALVYALKDAGAGPIALVVTVAVVASTWVITWLALRLSMAAPMTFAERQFRLFESWTLTRGHAGSLFGVGLILTLFCLVLITLLQAVAMAGVAGALIGGGYSEEALAAFLARPVSAWLIDAAPWVVLSLATVSVVGAGVMTIWYAAWAHAYRQLRGEAAA